MKFIGYARLGFPIEVNIDTGSISTLGTEIRAGLLHDWVELGYEITLLSEVKALDKSLITTSGLMGKSWFNELHINETGYPEIDVLFIECGSKNLMYAGKYGSYVERVNELVKFYNCKIIYYQHGHLPYFDLKKTDKDITILHHFANEDKFKEEFKNYKFNDKIKAKYMPLGYSESDKYLKPKSKPEMDMLWIGGENDSNKNQGTSRNTRKNLIKKYFGNVPYKAKVIGRWSEETVNELKEEVDFMGAQGKHGDAYGYFNDSLTTLWSGSISTKETGLIPTRPIMALRSGSIVLSEKDMYGVQTLIPDKYLIDSKESAINIIKELKLLSIEEREKICKEILSNFKQWKEFDWKNIFGIK